MFHKHIFSATLTTAPRALPPKERSITLGSRVQSYIPTSHSVNVSPPRTVRVEKDEKHKVSHLTPQKASLPSYESTDVLELSQSCFPKIFGDRENARPLFMQGEDSMDIHGLRRTNDQSSMASSSRSSVSMDEAYRRVGHRLSQTVGGDDHSKPTSLAKVGGNAQSAFAQPTEDDRIRNHAELGYDRTAKVAKTRYTDHGAHQKLVAGSILKNLTYHARDTFSTLREQTQHTPPQKGKKRISPTFSISPHRQALSALALEEKPPENKGLLQAVLDASNSSGSSAATTPISHEIRARGKCLTSPSDPVSNDGRDNADGNLIVHENDRIFVLNRHVHILVQDFHQLQVVKLLGQGTFAQVFQCQCLHTGKIVALKVVKNKPAYTRQAAVEIDVFSALSGLEKENMVQLQCYFMYHHHLCLVFELLGLNLYEVLKRRQFRGLPLPMVRTLIRQVLGGIKDLAHKNIVHCDLKPENILLTNDDDVEVVVHAGEGGRRSVDATEYTVSSFGGTPSTDDTGRTSTEASSQMEPIQKIKLIDFGSACFEGHAAHTYIQSRFYRSPEVLVGLPYDSAIDMWSMGCVAAELFLGLPILPGVHEHDQLGRISEMIGPLPDRMLEQGSKSSKYFVKQLSRPDSNTPDVPSRTPSPATGSSPPPPKTTWRLKTQAEYIQSLSASEIRKKGGLAKLQKQPTNRYFKRKRLVDIITHHGQSSPNEDRETLGLFAHFLMGVLDPDPLKRWTAYQASMHPFITGDTLRRRRASASVPETVSREFDIYWAPPWDPVICRRKLLDVQRTREKQRALRRSFSGGHQARSLPSEVGGRSVEESLDSFSASLRRHPASPAIKRSPRTSMDTMASMNRPNRPGIPESVSRSQGDGISPPSSLGTSLSYQAYPGIPPQLLTGSLGSSMGAGNMSDSGRMMSNLHHLAYGVSSSLSDYSSGAAVQSSMHGMNLPYADFSMAPPMQGPQSFSGIHAESYNQLSVEADFGYALQRPGVFPGMGTPGSGTMLPQVSGSGYSPDQMPAHQRSRSFTHSGGNRTPMQRRRTTTGAPNDLVLSPGNRGQSQFMPRNFVSPTSIKEDSTDFVLGMSQDSPSDRTRRSSAPSSATGSLLSQQLEERSAGQRADSYQERMHVPPDGGVANSLMPPPAYIGGARPAAYPPNVGQPASVDTGQYYYTTYMNANGVVMSAPVNMDIPVMPAPVPAYGAYGSFPDNQMPVSYGPPNTLQQVQYPPAYLSQPALEETEQNRPPQRYYNHQGTSM